MGSVEKSHFLPLYIFFTIDSAGSNFFLRSFFNNHHRAYNNAPHVVKLLVVALVERRP